MSLISSLAPLVATSQSRAMPPAPADRPPGSVAVLRARLLIAPVPVGALIHSETGTAILRVLGMTRLHTAGTSPDKDAVRLTYARVRRADLPERATIRPWPFRAADGPVERQATDPGRLRQSIRQAKREGAVAQLKRVASFDDGEPVVPLVATQSVMAADGTVLRGPLTTRADWRDPDDVNPNRREPKKVAGVKRADPLETALLRPKQHDYIALRREHVIAADQYRYAWEIGPGGARPGADRFQGFTDRAFGPSSGPTEVQSARMEAWRRLDAQFSPAAQDALHYIVLDRNPVSKWAAKVGGDRRYASGFLVGVLDALWHHFRAEVDEIMRRDSLAVVED